MADYQFELKDGTGIFTFNRPEVLNALTLELYVAFRDLLLDLRSEGELRALILTGEGRAFCSGGDVHKIIGELLEQDMRSHLEFTRMTGDVVRNMRLLDVPIIAAVNGIAAGAGAVIALAADLRVVSDEAVFNFLFTKVGLTGADMGAAYLLPKIVGEAHAKEILLLGGAVDAQRAFQIGMATKVVPNAEVLGQARSLADQLVAGPPFAIAMTKRLIHNEAGMDLQSALETEAQAQALLMMGDDHRIFYESFKEKSDPEFRGR